MQFPGADQESIEIVQPPDNDSVQEYNFAVNNENIQEINRNDDVLNIEINSHERLFDDDWEEISEKDFPKHATGKSIEEMGENDDYYVNWVSLPIELGNGFMAPPNYHTQMFLEERLFEVLSGKVENVFDFIHPESSCFYFYTTQLNLSVGPKIRDPEEHPPSDSVYNVKNNIFIFENDSLRQEHQHLKYKNNRTTESTFGKINEYTTIVMINFYLYSHFIKYSRIYTIPSMSTLNNNPLNVLDNSDKKTFDKTGNIGMLLGLALNELKFVEGYHIYRPMGICADKEIYRDILHGKEIFNYEQITIDTDSLVKYIISSMEDSGYLGDGSSHWRPGNSNASNLETVANDILSRYRSDSDGDIDPTVPIYWDGFIPTPTNQHQENNLSCFPIPIFALLHMILGRNIKFPKYEEESSNLGHVLPLFCCDFRKHHENIGGLKINYEMINDVHANLETHIEKEMSLEEHTIESFFVAYSMGVPNEAEQNFLLDNIREFDKVSEFTISGKEYMIRAIYGAVNNVYTYLPESDAGYDLFMDLDNRVFRYYDVIRLLGLDENGTSSIGGVFENTTPPLIIQYEYKSTVSCGIIARFNDISCIPTCLVEEHVNGRGHDTNGAPKEFYSWESIERIPPVINLTKNVINRWNQTKQLCPTTREWVHNMSGLVVFGKGFLYEYAENMTGFLNMVLDANDRKDNDNEFNLLWCAASTAVNNGIKNSNGDVNGAVDYSNYALRGECSYFLARWEMEVNAMQKIVSKPENGDKFESMYHQMDHEQHIITKCDGRAFAFNRNTVNNLNFAQNGHPSLELGKVDDDNDEVNEDKIDFPTKCVMNVLTIDSILNSAIMFLQTTLHCPYSFMENIVVPSNITVYDDENVQQIKNPRFPNLYDFGCFNKVVPGGTDDSWGEFKLSLALLYEMRFINKSDIPDAFIGPDKYILPAVNLCSAGINQVYHKTLKDVYPNGIYMKPYSEEEYIENQEFNARQLIEEILMEPENSSTIPGRIIATFSIGNNFKNSYLHTLMEIMGITTNKITKIHITEEDTLEEQAYILDTVVFGCYESNAAAGNDNNYKIHDVVAFYLFGDKWGVDGEELVVDGNHEEKYEPSLDDSSLTQNPNFIFEYVSELEEESINISGHNEQASIVKEVAVCFNLMDV